MFWDRCLIKLPGCLLEICILSKCCSWKQYDWWPFSGLCVRRHLEAGRTQTVVILRSSLVSPLQLNSYGFYFSWRKRSQVNQLTLLNQFILTAWTVLVNYERPDWLRTFLDMHGQQDVTGRCSLSLFSGVEHKKHTTFHFLQKFIKQFSCLQLQPVEREREEKKTWGIFRRPADNHL